ncbi:Protein CBG26286 [Caenorhabditis briggsae]|nr:Protein CBG26286 [Caenorhabditis briggsae]CAS00914.1 Protein CBG26286 [Caenorhabditis briggsae]
MLEVTEQHLHHADFRIDCLRSENHHLTLINEHLENKFAQLQGQFNIESYRRVMAEHSLYHMSHESQSYKTQLEKSNLLENVIEQLKAVNSALAESQEEQQKAIEKEKLARQEEIDRLKVENFNLKEKVSDLKASLEICHQEMEEFSAIDNARSMCNVTNDKGFMALRRFGDTVAIRRLSGNVNVLEPISEEFGEEGSEDSEKNCD